MADEPAFLLDITRLVSRLGGGVLTGIDRVEAEWLQHLQSRDHLLLCRSRRGHMLLAPAAGAELLRWLMGDDKELAEATWLDRLRKGPLLRRRALRRLGQSAILNAGRDGRGIAQATTSRLGQRVCYLNLGHTNFNRRLWAALSPLRRVVLIHDTIPLDHPEFTRSGQSEAFRARFMTAVGMADLILTVSQASADAVALWRGRLGVRHRAPIIPAPIGTRLAPPRQAVAAIHPDQAYFVTLGTIEPRKNHALLLDVWEELSRRLPASQIPHLLIIGRRGWENQKTFARLDALPQNGPVQELADLDDGDVAGLLLGTRALLMPSHAEGFGLPLTEAAGRGVPVISAPLASAQEILGKYACYVRTDDPIGWTDKIEQMAKAGPIRNQPLPVIGWPDHFMRVQEILNTAD